MKYENKKNAHELKYDTNDIWQVCAMAQSLEVHLKHYSHYNALEKF